MSGKLFSSVLLLFIFVSYFSEAYLFDWFMADCSNDAIRSCGGGLADRIIEICKRPLYNADCDLDGKCCNEGGCSDCYIESCCK